MDNIQHNFVEDHKMSHAVNTLYVQDNEYISHGYVRVIHSVYPHQTSIFGIWNDDVCFFCINFKVFVDWYFYKCAPLFDKIVDLTSHSKSP